MVSYTRSKTNKQWRVRLDDTADFLEEIRQCKTMDRLCTCVLGHISHYGATCLLAGVIPHPGSARREQLGHVILDAWPQEWSERYFSCGYLHRDPTIQLVKRGAAPFLWSEVGELYRLDADNRRVMDEAGEFHLRQGLTFAFSAIGGRPVGFSIAGQKIEADTRDRALLQLTTAFAFGNAIMLSNPRHQDKAIRLSPRQLDVLRWAAEGLKVDEIAERLCISGHTADMHLRAIREKLGVSNTLHAVAEAFRLRLLS
ncbi:helix-turn-helix transcriptional regulator [Aminobacter sp. Piv2-1]|uniref:helix-turn-helix transcriptional regulator n=1 Tax=Aminobacter sp. Piv2-1 TaxID=3031122 RepID=UPI0030B6BCD3